jgi:hypothetical protein
MIEQIIETLGERWGITGEFLWEMSLREFACEVRKREGSQRVIRNVVNVWTRSCGRLNKKEQNVRFQD